MIGKKLGRFEVVERLDAGGQGEIYRARHKELDLDVAVKVLRERSALDPTARKLFLREAHTLAKLKHPHIGAIHDFVSEDDTDYLVMELVPGTDLGTRLEDGALPEPEVLRLGTQIAQALEEAHEQHIVHLDLKPKNVMVTPKGQVKVLDFGLARLVRPIDEATTRSMTDVQRVAGTLPYMAPEQLKEAADVDARTDVYALGVTLYEMATGRRPFQQDDPTKLITAILQSEPTHPGALREGISSGLERVILKALAKDPAQRYQTVNQLREDLERCAAGVAVSAPSARPRWINRWTLGVATAAVVIVAIWLMIVRPPTVAVLPVQNLTGDPKQDFFAEGMHTTLISELYGISGLKVIGSESSKRFNASVEPLSQIAAALDARYIVRTKFMSFDGNRVKISAELTEASSDQVVWAATFDRETSDFLNLMSELAAFIAEHVEVALRPEEEERLRQTRPVHPQALVEYFRGREFQYEWTEEDIRRAMDFYRRAIDLDPEFALAYVGLAESWHFLGAVGLEAIPAREAVPKAKVELGKALELDASAAEARVVLGQISLEYDWDWETAEREYERAIELQPSFAMARVWYSQLLSAAGRHDEALDQVRRAKTLDPYHPFVDVNVLARLWMSGDSQGAIDAGNKALETHPDNWVIRWQIGIAQVLAGRYDAAVTTLEEAVPLSENNSFALSMLGCAYARAGMRDKATAILGQLENVDPVSEMPVAQLHAALGDLDAGFAWLERAYENRKALTELKTPFYSMFHGDPRLDDLARRVGIPD